MEEKQITVPYILYEGEMARAERRQKRNFILILILVAALLLSTNGWRKSSICPCGRSRRSSTKPRKHCSSISGGNSPDFSCEKIFSKNIKKSIDI